MVAETVVSRHGRLDSRQASAVVDLYLRCLWQPAFASAASAKGSQSSVALGIVSASAAVEGTVRRRGFRREYRAALASVAWEFSAPSPDRYPVGRSELEPEVMVALPRFQGLELAGAVDVIEHHGGVGGEALGECG